MARSATRGGTSRRAPTIHAVADLHGWLPPITACDVLLIAGDVCPHFAQPTWLATTFREWLEAIPAKRIVMTWGNHDFVGQGDEVPALPCTVLVDEEATVAGVRIYGTPWSVGSGFNGWAYQEDDDVLEGIYRRIPEGIDILLSHSPPLGWCDVGPRGQSLGSASLLNAVQAIQPSIVVCGHVHEARGSKRAPWGRVANVSAVDGQYKPRRRPVVRLTL
jgi:Icc-related predicted phosphoesterase